MKKIMLAMLIALAAVGIVSAQGFGWGNGQTVSVQGTLGLQNGVIALTSGDTVYYVPHLSRYVGFIDGLKEGAPVKIDGYTFTNQVAAFLEPAKLTVGGKDYDLSHPQNGNGYAMGRRGAGHRGAYGGGGGCGGAGMGHHGMGRW